MNLATGIGGWRCSKRGSVSLNFKVKDTNFRIINMHLKNDSFANRLRDLSKILEVHRMALEDRGTNIFLVGAFNFGQAHEIPDSNDDNHSSCELLVLKEKSGENPLAISQRTETNKKIDKTAVLGTIARMKEGDLDEIINRVRNKIEEGVTQSLFHDRIFWLESSYIKNLDYDVRVENLTNDS